MSQLLALATAAAEIPGMHGPHSLFSLSQLISDLAKDIRGNRASVLALSRRIDEIVAIVTDQGQNDQGSHCAVDSFCGLLTETLETLQSLGQRTVVSQLFHLERDKERIKTLAERVEIALEALKLRARTSAAALLATAEAIGPRAQTLARLDALAASGAAAVDHTVPPQAVACIPPEPPLLFGRAAETQTVVDSVLATQPGHAAILGGPGLGKTTLALSVLHQPSVESHFGTRRYFVECSAAEGPSGLLRVVAARLGILGTDAQAVQRALRFVLGGLPSLLLLAHVENVPLGIVLLANLAQTEPLEALVRRWEEEKTRMLASGSGGTRLSSLDVSISLSIQCPRMLQIPAALRLLRQLAMLPVGAADSNLALWTGHDPRALATLLRVSLALSMPERRTYMLAPIRTFVRERMPVSDDEVSILKAHYFGLAATVNRDDQFPSQPEAVSVLVHEIANIETLIEHSFRTSHSLLPALHAIAQLCRLHFDTEIPAGNSKPICSSTLPRSTTILGWRTVRRCTLSERGTYTKP
ncbi:hypothetical protein AURDEDRAFT_126012 [Auricularia subglabra TFB-10046 SS5]|nr:hypothetical protein AURDEDRAFT_126012 [Auricularia subglabra TFB-10046 SS5]